MSSDAPGSKPWSTIPPEGVPVPPVVRSLAGADVVEPVWHNDVGGLTFQLGDGEGRRFVKWNPRGNEIDLSDEVPRLAWASRFTPVPEVLETGADDEATWVVTRGLPGESAVSPRWRRQPAVAVTAIGEGLRALHDRLPVGECPFSWSDDDRRAAARRRAAVGEPERVRWHPEHRHLTWDSALAVLADAPEVDLLVVCHGDPCSPNTLVDDGRWSGHVDLGALGVADRWADLAVACWSAEWNYGPGWTPLLLDAYGVDDDADRRAWYRLLWDLT